MCYELSENFCSSMRSSEELPYEAADTFTNETAKNFLVKQ